MKSRELLGDHLSSGMINKPDIRSQFQQADHVASRVNLVRVRYVVEKIKFWDLDIFRKNVFITQKLFSRFFSKKSFKNFVIFWGFQKMQEPSFFKRFFSLPESYEIHTAGHNVMPAVGIIIISW